MKFARIKNQKYYDRTFFGIGVTIKTEEMPIDQEEFEILNKNCRNFQDMTNPPEHGGEPTIRVLGSTPSGDVRVNGKNLNKPTEFTAPEVLLRGNEITKVPKPKYDKLKENNRFNSFIEDGELRFMGMEEK